LRWAPGPGHQDHTTWPSVSGVLVCHAIHVHRMHARLTRRNDRAAPLLIEAGCDEGALISEKNESGVFSGAGLDRSDAPETACEIGFYAQAVFLAFGNVREMIPCALGQVRADLPVAQSAGRDPLKDLWLPP
jgi:hypothetical protein